jgi:hypothetical protein
MTKVKGEEYIWKGKYGYLVNMGFEKQQLHASFAVSKYGSWEKALEAAKQDRDLKVLTRDTVRYARKWGNYRDEIRWNRQVRGRK